MSLSICWVFLRLLSRVTTRNDAASMVSTRMIMRARDFIINSLGIDYVDDDENTNRRGFDS